MQKVATCNVCKNEPDSFCTREGAQRAQFSTEETLDDASRAAAAEEEEEEEKKKAVINQGEMGTCQNSQRGTD